MSRKSRKHASKRKAAAERPASAMDSLDSPTKGHRADLGICLALVLGVLLVFGRSVWFGFVDFDDPGIVSENPIVRQGISFSGILWAFTHSQVSSWVPLATLSHMLDCQLFGLWAGGHHLTSVLLHAVTSVLLFRMLREMTGAFWRCAFVAALFALHPLRAETVAWISERKDVLSGLFFVLTLHAYVRWTRRPGSSPRWVYAFLTLGLLSKAMLVTTPFVLLLLDQWPLQRTARIRITRLVIEKIPLLLLCIAAAVIQFLVANPTSEAGLHVPFATRAANALVSCSAYVVQMFWPANLAGFYPFPRNGVSVQALLSAVTLLVVISAAAYRWRRQAPWIATGWLWYLIMLAPVLGLMQAGEAARADRYTYLPQIGLYLIVAWTLGSWCADRPRLRVPAGALAALVIVAAAAMTYRQTGYWKNGETMWNRALACTQNNDLAHYNLGTRRLREGRFEEAISHFRKTLEANPAYADAHINLGRSLLQKGMLDEAVAHFHEAIDIKPRYAEAHYNLAVVLAMEGRMEDAINHYRQAIEIAPGYLDAHNNLGSLHHQAGRMDQAISHYKVALRIDPRSAKVHNNLATAYAQKGRRTDAVAHFQKVLEVEPDHPKALNGLAWLLATSGEDSIRNGARAVELAERCNQQAGGSNPLMLRTLAAALAEAGLMPDALKTAQRALELAKTQGNDPLSRGLSDDMDRYKSGQPVR